MQTFCRQALAVKPEAGIILSFRTVECAILALFRYAHVAIEPYPKVILVRLATRVWPVRDRVDADQVIHCVLVKWKIPERVCSIIKYQIFSLNCSLL